MSILGNMSPIAHLTVSHIWGGRTACACYFYGVYLTLQNSGRSPPKKQTSLREERERHAYLFFCKSALGELIQL